jgi:hypothetical protein
MLSDRRLNLFSPPPLVVVVVAAAVAASIDAAVAAAGAHRAKHKSHDVHLIRKFAFLSTHFWIRRRRRRYTQCNVWSLLVNFG